MARKIIVRDSPGTADTFGANDTNYINKLLTGEDQSTTDPVTINTDWTFKDLKLKLADTGGTNAVTVDTATQSGNRTLEVPALSSTSSNNEIVCTGLSQTLTGKTIDATQNTLLNVGGSSFPNGETRKAGGWMGGHYGATWGMFSSDASFNPMTITGTGAASYTVDPTLGKYTTLSTTSSSGADAGWHSDTSGNVVTMALSPRLKCKFKLAQVSSVRVFIGFSTHTPGSFSITGDSPLSSQSGVLLNCQATDLAQFVINHNDGDTTQHVINLEQKDTDVHTIEIKTTGDPPTGWQYQWDGGPTTTINSSEVPALNTLLYPYFYIETSSSNSKSMSFWYWLVECNT